MTVTPAITIFMARLPERMRVPAQAPPQFASWEIERYSRLRSQAARTRFLAGRLLVRHGLSRLSGGTVGPLQWRFGREPHGRPVLDPTVCGEPLWFSISASGGLVAAAVSTAGPVGLDIERLEHKGYLHIPAALAKAEQDLLSRLARRSRHETTLLIWTIKEAVAKLTGLGLFLDLTSFSVLPGPSSPMVRLDPSFPFSLRDVHIATSRLSLGNSQYFLALAAARRVEKKKISRKKGIKAPAIRIPVREMAFSSLHLEKGNMIGGHDYVDDVAGNGSGIWRGASWRRWFGNVGQAEAGRFGRAGSIPAAPSL